MKVLISQKQHDYLRTIIGMDLRVKNERLLHAASHGSHYVDIEVDMLQDLLHQLSEAYLDSLIGIEISHGD